MKIEELKWKKIAILWFWKEGQSALRFLEKQGIEDITILDKNQLQPSSLSIKGGNSKVDYVFWESYLDSLEDFDIIIKTPGISPFHEKILPYKDKCISSTQIFFSHYLWKVVGITGTKGKSTVSTLIYTCLQNAWYNVKLVWNIGAPVLDEIDIFWNPIYDYVIYEMSSFMLQDFTPRLELGFLNNIYPCHLDWHYDSWNIYKDAKLNILRNAKIQIVNGDLSMDADVAWLSWKNIYFNSKGDYKYSENNFFIDNDKVFEGKISLLWDHNKQNICWVIAILDKLVDNSNILKNTLNAVLADFKWLPNRTEDIGVYEGIRFINDAIATTPESSMAAIDTFKWDLQTLFIWWEDSGFNFDDIREKILTSNIQNIIAFPYTSEKIFPEIQARDYEKAFEIEIEWKLLQIIKTRSMKQWVDFAYKTTLPGRIALLSCAAPSFSLWKSYLQKAEEFKKEVIR